MIVFVILEYPRSEIQGDSVSVPRAPIRQVITLLTKPSPLNPKCEALIFRCDRRRHMRSRIAAKGRRLRPGPQVFRVFVLLFRGRALCGSCAVLVFGFYIGSGASAAVWGSCF